MKFLQRISLALLMLSLAVGVAAGAWWLVTVKPGSPKVEKPAPAALVAKPVKEDELNTVALTETSERQLGVKIGVVELKPVRRVRIYGGEVAVPAGRAIVVSAPLGGMLRAPADGVPKIGQRLAKNQPVLVLLPLLTPEARTTMASAQVDADGLLKNAETSLDAARIALERAKRLFREQAGSQRNVDETQATFDLASKTLEAARARRDLLAKAVGEIQNGTAAPIAINAPDGGLLRNLSALPGQNVPSGAALFEIVDLERVWVRVPLPAADLDEISRADDVTVGQLTARPGAKSQLAKPVVAPPTANPLSATIDVIYETDNRSGQLIPGQRVGVAIPLEGAKESLTVPWSAVVFDVHGGTWVYEQTGTRTFVRRRVEVRYVVGADAVLEDGPVRGTKIVAIGGLELFGAETGSGK